LTPTRLVQALALAGGLFTVSAQAQVTAPPSPAALPVLRTGGTLIGAAAPLTTTGANGPVMTINQNQARAIIDWSSFNIGSAATVTVSQPSATAILLNRVVAGAATQGPSTLAGTLQANGRVFVLDPNGVLVNGTARVHTGGLLLAGMVMSSADASFLDGSALTLARDATQGTVAVDAGALITGGTAAAPAVGGDVALLGVARTRMDGVITASRVFVGAGGGATVPVGDSGFITLKLTPATADIANYLPPTVDAAQSGQITATGGQVIVQTAGSGETPVNWSANIDASGGTLDMSGSALDSVGLQIAGSSFSTASVPVQLRATDINLSGSSGTNTGLSLTDVSLIADQRLKLQGSAIQGVGVALGNTISGSTSLQAPAIVVTGHSSTATGVLMSGGSLGGASIDLRGIAGTTDAGLTNANTLVTGAALTGTLSLDAGGHLSVAGRGELPATAVGGTAYGLRLAGLNISTPGGAGGLVSVAGEAVNSVGGAGIFGVNPAAPLFSLRGVGAASAVDLLIGADTVDQGAAFQSSVSTSPVTPIVTNPPTPTATVAAIRPGIAAVTVASALATSPDIVTTGHVNVRPLGVDSNGNLVEHTTRAIQLGSDPAVANTSFLVPIDWLNGPGVSGGGIGTSRLVIGSALQQAAIHVDAGAMGATTPALTLQNQAAGSAGVTLGGTTSVVPDLSVLSAGPVTQTGALAVQNLQLQGAGAAGSVVTLNDSANEIGHLAFAGVASLAVTRLGTSSRLPVGLTLGAADTLGFDPASGQFGTLSIVTSSALDRATVQTDQLTLANGVTVTGSGSRLDLVASTSFSSPNGAQVAAGPGGSWRIWTPVWTGVSGSVNGGQAAPNLYGCTFGDVSTCSISQVALPAGRSGFFFAQQPTLTVDPLPVSSERGQILPTLGYTVSGLVAGDTATAAVSGNPATAANAFSPVGVYPATVGSLVSPLGYRVQLADTLNSAQALTLTPATGAAPPTPPFVPGGVSGFLQSTSSETYGRNLSAPSLCLVPGAARRERQVGDSQDLLGMEWARVRLQPQVSSCLQIADEPGCAGF
jgi:filamentous hemagglutinin family protein